MPLQYLICPVVVVSLLKHAMARWNAETQSLHLMEGAYTGKVCHHSFEQCFSSGRRGIWWYAECKAIGSWERTVTEHVAQKEQTRQHVRRNLTINATRQIKAKTPGRDTEMRYIALWHSQVSCTMLAPATPGKLTYSFKICKLISSVASIKRSPSFICCFIKSWSFLCELESYLDGRLFPFSSCVF